MLQESLDLCTLGSWICLNSLWAKCWSTRTIISSGMSHRDANVPSPASRQCGNLYGSSRFVANKETVEARVHEVQYVLTELPSG